MNRSLPLAWNISAKGCAEVADLPGGGEQGALRLEGLSLGNAWTDPVLDNRGTVDHWWVSRRACSRKKERTTPVGVS